MIRDEAAFPACHNFDIAVFFHKDEVQGVTRFVCWEENVLSEA